jgi:hypothetical protein
VFDWIFEILFSNHSSALKKSIKISSFFESTRAFPSLGKNKNELGEPKCNSGEKARESGAPSQ